MQWNAMLMPSAAHPWMNPLTETKLWPHDSNEVYDIYNKFLTAGDMAGVICKARI